MQFVFGYPFSFLHSEVINNDVISRGDTCNLLKCNNGYTNDNIDNNKNNNAP